MSKQRNYDRPFAERLRGLLEETGTSQNKLSEQINITRQAISEYTLGNTLPDAEKLEKIADYFNVTADYLLGRENGKNHYLDDMQKATGLSAKACEILNNWATIAPDIFHSEREILSYIIENTHQTRMLAYMYDYIFKKYFFTHPDKVTMEYNKDEKLYSSALVRTFTKNSVGGSIIESKHLNDMHFGEIMRAVTKLKDIRDKELEGEQNGNNNKT